MKSVFYLTTVLRWERDQNACRASTVRSSSLPQCSGGSEIKTSFQARNVQAQPYHSAPVGARSKHQATRGGFPMRLTTVLRWERDQNCNGPARLLPSHLPQCSGGSEIKTPLPRLQRGRWAYHSAPVGARSKLKHRLHRAAQLLTTVLRWERDQNMRRFLGVRLMFLPQCSGGSEIKTATTSAPMVPRTYHSAPVGARSKLCVGVGVGGGRLTTVLRWERDQNSTLR